jgi:hypothetical protein
VNRLVPKRIGNRQIARRRGVVVLAGDRRRHCCPNNSTIRKWKAVVVTELFVVVGAHISILLVVVWKLVERVGIILAGPALPPRPPGRSQWKVAVEGRSGRSCTRRPNETPPRTTTTTTTTTPNGESSYHHPNEAKMMGDKAAAAKTTTAASCHKKKQPNHQTRTVPSFSRPRRVARHDDDHPLFWLHSPDGEYRARWALTYDEVLKQHQKEGAAGPVVPPTAEREAATIHIWSVAWRVSLPVAGQQQQQYRWILYGHSQKGIAPR